MNRLATRLGVSLCAAIAPAAARPDPIPLEALTVRSGFEQAQLQERGSEDEPYWGKVHARLLTVEGAQGLVTQVVELRLGPEAPRNLAGYLRSWRASHGCTATQIRDVPALRLGASEPPQLTFEGTCKGGDVFVNRVLLVGQVAYELHVYALIGRETPGAHTGPRLREAMRDLASRIEPSAPASPATPTRSTATR